MASENQWIFPPVPQAYNTLQFTQNALNLETSPIFIANHTSDDQPIARQVLYLTDSPANKQYKTV